MNKNSDHVIITACLQYKGGNMNKVSASACNWDCTNGNKYLSHIEKNNKIINCT